jgi:hypothetical protein
LGVVWDKNFNNRTSSKGNQFRRAKRVKDRGKKHEWKGFEEERNFVRLSSSHVMEVSGSLVV